MKLSPIIPWVVVAVLVTLQVSSMFRGKTVNEGAIRNDEKVKSLEIVQKIKDSLYFVNIAAKDSEISILSDKILNNKTSIIQSNERIKTLPSRISSMSVDDIIRTIEQ